MALPANNIVTAIFMTLMLILCLSIFAPSFAQNLSNQINPEPSNNTLSTSNLQKLTINANGPLASLQNDNNGTWIIWGDWDLINNASNAVKTTSSPLTFNATIIKVKTDNTEDQKYKIYNFKPLSSDIATVGSSSVLMFNGTGTISTNDESSQVPINIGIIDSAPVTASIDMESGAITPSWVPKGGTISILIDNEVLSDQFGNSPIYGIVKKAKGS
jgi:hypothetical protein